MKGKYMANKFTLDGLEYIINDIRDRLEKLENNQTAPSADFTYPIPCSLGTIIYTVRNAGYVYPDYHIMATRYDKSHLSQNLGTDFFLTFEEAEKVLKSIGKR